MPVGTEAPDELAAGVPDGAPDGGPDEEGAAASTQLSLPTIPDKEYFRIGEVAKLLGVKPYVLRFWETEFPVIRPQKSRSQQRVYRRRDVERLRDIQRLLHEERYTIEGARKRLRELASGGPADAPQERIEAAVAAATEAAQGPLQQSADPPRPVTPGIRREIVENVKKELEEVLKLVAE
jgi:DNA-binding transcriptional MerR regulator